MVIRIIIMKNIIFYLSLMLSMLVSFTSTAEQEAETFSDAELAQMLAPIALYPDSLLTHILIASTYPIEVIEAHRWLKKNDGLNKKKREKLLDDLDWDASVKALIPFERVLSRLSEDLSWTQSLGDAFLQDESRLLSSIQALRKKAKLAGSLSKMDNMDIDDEDNNISIISREKEVVYVPYYDSRIVYGAWFWPAYPPVYWHPRSSVFVSLSHPFHWHTGVHITFNYFFSAFHWHNRHVVIHNPRSRHYRYYHQRPRRLVANGGYAKRWSHKPAHRKGVAYRTKRTSEKYYGKRIGGHRANKQFASSHHKVKQRLSASKHFSHKAKHKAISKDKHKVNHRTNHKVKTQPKTGHKAVHGTKRKEVKSRHVSNKPTASKQNPRSKGARKQEVQSRKMGNQTSKQKSHNRVVSTPRKNQYRPQGVKGSNHKASRQQGRLSKSHHTKGTKNRRE
jgi:hypothetical protein